LLRYSGTVGADPNNTGAPLTMPGDRDGSGGGLGIRGLATGAPKRDGFIGVKTSNRSSFGYNDIFSTERIEVIEGPQSVLYGAVGGGGVINIVSKPATFNQQKASLSYMLDQWGSKRVEFDANVGTDRLAARVAAIAADSQNVRYNLGSEIA